MLEGGTFRADVSPDIMAGTPLIRGYGDDYFKIAHATYKTGISIHQNHIMAPWGPEHLQQLNIKHLQHIIQEQPPEVLIIGTGRQTFFPSESVLQTLANSHIGFECMDSRAAARTYNILVAEGRVVSAVFLLPNARN